MIYYANGGFNWNDLYFMPVKLREFYYRELMKVKELESNQSEKTKKSSNTSKTSRK
jgi:hypothetical protein